MHENDGQVETTDGRFLIIENEALPIKHVSLALDKVQLDPDNPRIQDAVKQKYRHVKISQPQLQALIMEQPGVSDLFVAIRDNGGLQEPIYVRPDGRVIEGNCRAACYLKLKAVPGSVKKWNLIPAAIVPNITERQVAILQGQQHVAGKNKWRAYEKVGHLYRMHHHLNMDPAEIAKSMGLRERDVKRDLEAYETMTNKLLPQMKNGSNRLEKWSFIQELYKRKGLSEYRAKEENINEFVSMVSSGKLTRGVDVRRLEHIVKVPSALKELKKKDIDSAISVAGKIDPTVDSAILKKLKSVTRLLQELPSKDLTRISEDAKAQQILNELAQALRNVARAAKIKLP
jgi:hypothetical protein